MSEPVVAPYGGLMTHTLEVEKERDAKIQELSKNVEVDGLTETTRPEALHIEGVDTLSTEDIKAFVDYYQNFEVGTEDVDGEQRITYTPYPIDEQIKFRIQWINDTSVNVVFESVEDSLKTLNSIVAEVPEEGLGIENSHIKRQAKPYTPILAFRKHQDLSTRLGLGSEEGENSTNMDEDESSIVLYVRQAFESDKKVKNAKAYSRYYLLHGEPKRYDRERPERSERSARPDREGRGGRARNRKNRPPRDTSRNQDDDEDLFAYKLKGHDDDEDLFADRMRDRSRSPMRLD